MVEVNEDGYFVVYPAEEVIAKTANKYVVVSMHEDDYGDDATEFVQNLIFDSPEEALSYYKDLAKGGVLGGHTERLTLFRLTPTHIITSTRLGAEMENV